MQRILHAVLTFLQTNKSKRKKEGGKEQGENIEEELKIERK